ncbi:MAG: hypothetical protein HPY83_04035 [Anaerolineae bacterium]|nr:hypothetical protein [Anaerolineae bacterium]
MTRRIRLVAYALLALGWGLRLRNLGGPELWFDEAASHFIAVRSPAGILSYVASAPFEHPPLYYLLLHGAMRLFGDSEWALRFPSVLLGALLLLGLWRAGLALSGSRLALATLGYAAVSPFLVTYSQEARMYALIQLLGLAVTALLYFAYRRSDLRFWLAYAALMALGVATHYFFAFLLPTHALILGLQRGGARRLAAHLGLAAVLVGILALGILFVAPGPRAAALQVIREGLWGKSPEAVGRLLQDWAYGGATITSRPSWAPALSLVALVPPLAGLLYRDLPARLRWALGLWVAVPTLLAIAVPYGGLVLRHFSYVAPALSLLTGAGLLRIGLRSRVLAPVGLLAVAATVAPGLAWQANHVKGHYRDALDHVAAHALPGDLVLLANPHQWVPWAYYDRTGLPTVSVGAGRPLPADAVGTAGRLWVLEWETWAVPDMPSVWDSLLGEGAIAYRLDYSTDVRLSLLYREPDTGPRVVAGPLRWDDARTLTGAAVWDSSGFLRPGDAAVVSLCWAADPPSDQSTVVLLRLADGHGTAWAEVAQPPRLSLPRNAPERCTRHALSLPGGIPGGEYTVQVGLVDLPTGARLAATGAHGEALGPWAPLGTITLAPAPYPLPPVRSGMRGQMSPHLEFLGSETDVESLSAGAYWSGFLQFRALAPIPDASPRVRLTSAGGTWLLGEVPLESGGLPASRWQPGEAWRCPSSFRLPSDLPSGDYRLEVQLAGSTDGSARRMRLPWQLPSWLEVDRFRVSARTFSVVDSEPAESLSVSFGNAIRLYGFSADREGLPQELRLSLYWEALAPTDGPYKVFVHLARPDEGGPLAQDDVPPAHIPTSEWLPGETYVSEHALPWPQGESELVLRVGLYSEDSMTRLPASGPAAQADHVELALGPGGLILAP